MNIGRCGNSGSRPVRTGTVLVLVVGVLVMIMLIGVALLMTTRTETARVAIERRVTDVDALLEQAIAHVREVLRTDLWGNDDVLFSNDRVRRPGDDGQLRTIDDVLVTLDEPFDAFANLGLAPSGQEILTRLDGRPVRATFVGDEWLGSTSPYFDPTVTGPPVGRLRWRRLSWVPLDEAAAITAARGAFDDEIRRQLPVNSMPFVRLLVDNVGLPVLSDNGADPMGTSDLRLDMNRWFKVAYLDADGDGIRDAVRLGDQFAGAGGERFDLAIRIVDHGSMLNLNAVFPWLQLRNWLQDSLEGRFAVTRYDDPDAASAVRAALSKLTRGEPLPLPGRNVTELLADQVIPPGEPGVLFQWTQAALTPSVSPELHAAEFLRKRLLSGSALVPYPSADVEAALRNRHSLLPYDSFNRVDNNLPVSRLVTDLRQTLVFQAPQYWRYDENETPRGGAYPLWMQRMAESPQFVRRPLFTTISKSQNRIQLPVSVATGAAAAGLPAWFALPMIGPQPIGRPTFHPVTGELIPATQRFELIDLNTDPTARDLNRNGVFGYNQAAQEPLDPLDVVVYARHLASAMWLVLEGEPRYRINDSPTGHKGLEDELLAFQGDMLEGPLPPLEIIGDDTRRRRMAWQFAVNVIDYRDADLVPTVYGQDVTGLAQPVYGVEPHPFITEVFVDISELVDVDGDGLITGAEADDGIYAVELYNPYPVPLDIGNWRLGTKSGIVDIPPFTIIPAHDPRVRGRDSFIVLLRKPGLSTSGATFVQVDFAIAGELIGGPKVAPADRFVELLLPASFGDVAVDRIEPTDAQDDFAKQVPGQVSGGGMVLVRAMGRTVTTDARGRGLELDQWQFSVARQGLVTESEQSLGTRNDIDLGEDVAPSPWIFPWVDVDANGTVDGHLGLPGRPDRPGGQAFDNVFQLSNVFLVGPDPSRAAGDPRKTVTGFVAEAQEFLRSAVPGLAQEILAAQTAAGRLNFFDVFFSTPAVTSPTPDSRPRALNMINAHPFDATLSLPPLELWTHRVLRYFGVGTAANDGINNDDDWVDRNNNGRREPGEERLDEETEDHDIMRSVVGRLNINTAPEEVLRAVSQFNAIPDDAQGVAEVAAAIVAYREDRAVNGFPAPRPLATYSQVPAVIRPYRSVADLSQIARNWKSLSQTFRGRPLDPRFRLDRYAVQVDQIGDLVFAPEVDFWGTGDGVPDDFRERQAILARVANLLTVRSDVYTIYIALVDRNDPQDPDDDVYVRRVQLTVDRTNCYRSPDVLPEIIARQDSGYYDVKR